MQSNLRPFSWNYNCQGTKASTTSGKSSRIRAMTNGSQVGRVVSLHLHPAASGGPLLSVNEVRAEAGKGLVGDARIFARKTRWGKVSHRQVSLMAREQIAQHAATLGLPAIAPGAVRANIETAGIDLLSLLGHEVKVGEAVLLFYEARTPCGKMDIVAPGLQKLMGNGQQGVMAQVISSGDIRVGDEICVSLQKGLRLGGQPLTRDQAHERHQVP
jgi:MOSC domain-containing protein YiiM